MNRIDSWSRAAALGAAAALSLAVAGCGDAGPSEPEEPAESVSIATPQSARVTVGDSVVLAAISSAGTVRWSTRAPRIAEVDPTSGVVQALRPGVAWVVGRAGEAGDSVRLTVDPRPGGYTSEEVDYFTEIALGFEFGGASEIVRRWATDIRYAVRGMPTPEDLATLADVVADLNALTTLHDLVEDPVTPAVEIHFVPRDRFTEVLPGAQPGNVGLFAVWWNSGQEIVQAVVLVSTDVSEELRTHLIREEVTQMLGLGQDSFLYPRSIFYQSFSLTDAFDPLDEAVIEMLYRPEVRIGMDERAVARVLRRLVRPGGVSAAEQSPDPGRPPTALGPAGSAGGN